MYHSGAYLNGNIETAGGHTFCVIKISPLLIEVFISSESRA